jgi:hypothetical protein
MARAARAAGFDLVIESGPADLQGTDFAARNAAILAEPVGAGCWLWKPWLIRRYLAECATDDVLIYSDVGRPGTDYAPRRLPEWLIARTRAAEHGFTVGPLLRQHGPLSRWCKRDALILLGADRPEILAQPSCQATSSLWRPTRAAFGLLDAWLTAAQDPRILTDAPNTCGLPDHPGFVDHRHDQSILSILVHRDGLPVLDVAPSGIFEMMALRPQARQTQLFLKPLDNIDTVASGRPYRAALAGRALRDLFGLHSG